MAGGEISTEVSWDDIAVAEACGGAWDTWVEQTGYEKLRVSSVPGLALGLADVATEWVERV